MAAKAATQNTEELQPIQAMALGESIYVPGSAGQALAELLVVRLANHDKSRLVEEATICGAAVKAAFDQLEKADEGK